MKGDLSFGLCMIKDAIVDATLAFPHTNTKQIQIKIMILNEYDSMGDGIKGELYTSV